MREDSLNHEDLFLEVHAGDQAVLVSTNVEDQAPTLLPKIGGREGPLHRREVPPIRVSSNGKETLERLPRGGVLASKACGHRLA